MEGMAQSLIVLIDTREQTPLQFPSVIQVQGKNKTYGFHIHTERTTLSIGDYCLENHRNGCVVERKGSLREVAMNCLSGDNTRFKTAITRLAESCRLPVLLFEGDYRSLLTPTTYVRSPGFAVDRLFQELLPLRIQMITCKSSSLVDRRHAGEMVLRLLIAGNNICPEQ